MTVEVIGREVEQNADRRIYGRSEIDLEGRALDDVVAAGARRIERQDRPADVAAERHLAAAHRQQMRDESRRGRLAVGAGDGDERRCRHGAATLAAEQFDVADDLDAGRTCADHWPGRLRMSERNAGRQHQGGEALPIGDPEIANGHARGFRCRDRIRAVVPSRNLGAAGGERERAAPLSPRPKTATFFPAKEVSDHLSLDSKADQRQEHRDDRNG